METLDRALIAIGAATALLLVMTIIATAAEREPTLEQIVRQQNAYWAQQREESDRRLDLSYQERQARALEAIEENTEGE